MDKKIINFSLLASLFCLSIGFTLFNLPVSNAQTTDSSAGTPSPTVSPNPEPTIEDDPEDLIIETELVNLNVRVVDRFNRPIANLQQSDFKVFQDKVPQEIGFFSKAEVPTNYALVIDNSGSLRLQLEKVIEASKIIVNTNKPEDETGLVRFISSDKIEIMQDFTSNKEDLFEELDNMYVEGGQTAIIDAIYLSAEKISEYEKSSNPNDRKRRALILVSDGEDRSSYYKEEQLFELLRESDVQIYAIGFVNDLDNKGGFIRKSDRKKAKNFLTRLATETGGRAFFPNDLSELNEIATNIADELRIQYSIGYIPSDDNAVGKFRNIKVLVKDGPKKQKRIAITKTGVIIQRDDSAAPTLQNKSNN